MRRRNFLLSAVPVWLKAAAAQPRSVVYKSVPDCEIKADVYRGGKHVAVYIHGGALIMGSRKLPDDSRMLRNLLEAGFTVVSIDYRLAPETKLPGIIEDLKDAFRWLRREAASLGIDGGRVAVCGSSAGGYLTLMAGFCIQPRPKALVSYWGYGDIVGRWYSRPDPFYLKQPAVFRGKALSVVGKSPLSEPPPDNERFLFYLYCRQQGLWPKEVAGHDPDTEDRWFDSYCPIRNVTRDYPPTMLVHGTADTDVPYEQSVIMAERLRRERVEHRLITVRDGDHGIRNIPPEEQERIYRDAAAFLRERV
ncbi:MAG TPA: alpha/beta hydrolase [Bryobacteraceae bacterium]|nr:alpha/beta hydrolase [Bryobacteraceae bacterium]HPQ14425.1 alpha/beta hydrolase [Bryobacteraceae bacterium]